MTAAEEFQAGFQQVALRSPVRVRKGQVPVGKGELALAGGILVLTVRDRERIRAPLGSVRGYVSSSQDAVDAYEFVSGLALIALLLASAFEGNYVRRIRRRDWKRVLGGEHSAGELLAVRADRARAKLEQDDLLSSRIASFTSSA